MLTFYNCDFDTTKSLPFKTCVQHGEDCQFQININVGGVPATSLSDYTWTAVYQDVSCLSTYYSIDAEDVSWNSETNAVDLYFRHKYDMGAIAYRVFVYGTKGDENTVPALIELGMLPNPIFSASHVEPVPPTLDFSQYNLVNAPWTELSDFNALSASLSNYVPTSTTVNGHALTGNVELNAHNVSTYLSNEIDDKVTLNGRGVDGSGFSAWTILRDGVDVTSSLHQPVFDSDGYWMASLLPEDGTGWVPYAPGGNDALYIEWEGINEISPGVYAQYTATRTALPGYILGPADGINADKPLPKLSDVPAVVAPSMSATTGEAADAKATGDALAGKLDAINPNYSSTPAVQLRWRNDGPLEILNPNGGAIKTPPNDAASLETIATREWVHNLPSPILPSAEIWTFTLSSGTTVTKSVAVY